jgi:hypothetical protein
MFEDCQRVVTPRALPKHRSRVVGDRRFAGLMVKDGSGVTGLFARRNKMDKLTRCGPREAASGDGNRREGYYRVFHPDKRGRGAIGDDALVLRLSWNAT